jgi:hypothetical protein
MTASRSRRGLKAAGRVAQAMWNAKVTGQVGDQTGQAFGAPIRLLRWRLRSTRSASS